MDDSGEVQTTEVDIAAAEKLILQWDPTASPARSSSSERMLFSDGADRDQACRFLRAVDEIRRSVGADPAVTASPRRLSSSSSSPSPSPAGALQIAMARLEDEFRNILVSKAHELEIDSLVDLSSLSMSSDRSGGFSDDEAEKEQDPPDSSSSSSRIASCRSTKSIREVELFSSDAVNDLRSIAERMVAAGYVRECVQVYSSVRKSAIDLSLRHLGVEKLSIGDVQRLEWDALEAKIRRWIRSARACVRIIFASERRLSELVFEPDEAAPFAETVKSAAIQLFGFAEAISIGRRSPEKLFKILDLHDAISDLLPDVAAVFRSDTSDSISSIHTQVAETLTRLTEAVRGILSEFESAVLREPSRIPVPGGTIHPLTRYVMNYISLISDYRQTLVELIVSRPSASARFSGEDSGAGVPEIELPELENQSPLASHLVWIIAILQYNLENKANLYKDASLSHLFLMNNVHYIVQKVKGSPELRELIGDDYLKKMTGKFRQSATSYQRATWVRVLYCLREEGIHVSGSFSSGVSKSTLRERFKSFNAAFEETHRIQATWFVPDTQLREELRISISEKLLPAYRSFLGRFRQHIENGKHPEMYIKYSVEDLELALADFFEGCAPNLLSRKRSH
ncbi:exocyst complex component EXO70A1-like [Iris pallida]|uniref:Exocyst subunit Exo70 family protein n=1 Tax=Iris pallida TaxID=29817 RepID=A0AAX6FVZ9_IRIPA|nr:exocyst complex component EXO70A1-like [Iris pallida]